METHIEEFRAESLSDKQLAALTGDMMQANADLISLREELEQMENYIDAIPIAAIVRYWRNSSYDVRRAKANGYATEMFDDDDALIEEWVNAMEYAQKSDAYSDAWTSADINE